MVVIFGLLTYIRKEKCKKITLSLTLLLTLTLQSTKLENEKERKVFQIGTVRYNWPMSAHKSQAFSIAHCTDSEDLPKELNKLH